MKKIKLTVLESQNISLSDSKKLLGGAGSCCCGCIYRDSGGSSIAANSSANNAGDLVSRDSFWCGTGDGR